MFKIRTLIMFKIRIITFFNRRSSVFFIENFLINLNVHNSSTDGFRTLHVMGTPGTPPLESIREGIAQARARLEWGVQKSFPRGCSHRSRVFLIFKSITYVGYKVFDLTPKRLYGSSSIEPEVVDNDHHHSNKI